MFALCHFKDNEDNFILYDEKDLKELAEHLNIEIEKEISFEELEKEYFNYPILAADDLFVRALSKRTRTATHILDELGISNWEKLKAEYEKVQEKKSYLSRSQRELVEKQYNLILSLK